MKNAVMFGILISVLNSGKVTVNELSLKYEISRRTVLRYIDALCMAHIPLITHKGRNGGVSIADNFIIDRVFFTENELKRLFDCLNGMSGLFSDGLTDFIKDKLCCISANLDRHILASNSVIIDAGPWGDIKSYRDKFTPLEKAINGNLKTVIVYRDVSGAESERTICPYTLVFKQGLWYIYAYCNLRQNFRLFKIGRIVSINLTEETFFKHDIDIKSLPYNIKWFENESSINVVFKISASIKSDIEEWLSYENVKEHSNGNIYAFAKLPKSGLIQRILSFGTNIEVIEPANLRRDILNTVKGIEKLYE